MARTLRSVLYELISLSEPAGASPQRAFPEPCVDGDHVTSYAVHTRRLSTGEVQVRRIPAAVDAEVRGATEARSDTGGWLRHLAVDDGEWDLRMVHSASVFVREEPASVESAAAWAQTTLSRLPGAQMVAAGIVDGCVAVLRDGRRIEVRVTVGSGCAVMLQAACVHTLLRTDALVGAVRLRVGDTATLLHISI